jgi:hypothetical protein
MIFSNKSNLKKITSTLLMMLAFILFCNINSFAQKNSASAKLDSVKIKLGDQTSLNISIDVPLGSKVQFPTIADTINSHIEVVQQSKVDTSISADKQRVTLNKKLIITSFDSGYFVIAPFPFIVDGDTANPLLTDALLIQVQTVSVDTTQAIRDIKGPKDAPWNIREIIPYLIGGGVALLIALLVIYYLRKRKVKPEIIVEKKPIIPPHILVLQQLQALQEEKMWQQGKVKEYQSSVSDIIRNYIELRFEIGAMEQTTDETMRSFRGINLSDDLKFKLKQLLSLSDMVKFAKEQPLPMENEKSMSDAIDFVKGTIPAKAQQLREEEAV